MIIIKNEIKDSQLEGNSMLPSNFLVFCFLIAFLLSTNSIQSQTKISTTDFLETATSEQSILYEQEALNFLKNTPHSLPILDQLELRTESDEFKLNRQEYTMRLGLNSEKERYSYNNFHQSNIEVAEKEKQLLLQEELMNRYQILLKYYEIEQEVYFEKERKLVLEDKLKVMRKLVQLSTDLDLNDLIEAEDKFHELERALLEMEGMKRQLKSSVQRTLNISGTIEIDTANFISIDKIRVLLSGISDSLNYHPGLDFRQARVNQSMAEYELELAERFKFLDYLQVKYSGRDNLDFGREISIGLGIQIPLKKANQIDLNELKLENIENENQLEGLQLGLSEEIQTKKQSLNLLFQQYDLVLKQFADSQLSYSLDNFQELANEKPLTLLKIRESQIRRQKTLSNIENEIREAYIELLELTGKIVSSPTINWLSENLEVLNLGF